MCFVGGDTSNQGEPRGTKGNQGEPREIKGNQGEIRNPGETRVSL